MLDKDTYISSQQAGSTFYTSSVPMYQRISMEHVMVALRLLCVTECHKADLMEKSVKQTVGESRVQWECRRGGVEAGAGRFFLGNTHSNWKPESLSIVRFTQTTYHQYRVRRHHVTEGFPGGTPKSCSAALRVFDKLSLTLSVAECQFVKYPK
ncbi:hypothetical protein KIL84_022867 [Mauremys mutica]|uniref:Uncharacterized protein n=1 Tax=Mauremys mutica TaxID=74926 RepID=A0A9D3WQ59_9SAUR|nr:hypothetical protein KIL84_022867 [Mauremys mutica]